MEYSSAPDLGITGVIQPGTGIVGLIGITDTAGTVGECTTMAMYEATNADSAEANTTAVDSTVADTGEGQYC
jgi:hypothetical protein